MVCRAGKALRVPRHSSLGNKCCMAERISFTINRTGDRGEMFDFATLFGLSTRGHLDHDIGIDSNYARDEVQPSFMTDKLLVHRW